jgi:hypothetical protein
VLRKPARHGIEVAAQAVHRRECFVGVVRGGDVDQQLGRSMDVFGKTHQARFAHHLSHQAGGFQCLGDSGG